VIAAYGQILRQRVLDLPSRGALNVHSALLPRWRGAAPVAAAILAGDIVSGVTIMEVVRALDAGPMVAKVEIAVSPHDTAGTLEARLAHEGRGCWRPSMTGTSAGSSLPQDDDDATARLLRRQMHASTDRARDRDLAGRHAATRGRWRSRSGVVRDASEAGPDGNTSAEPGTVLA
jgi:methionyl-tRNA formyltransferase